MKKRSNPLYLILSGLIIITLAFASCSKDGSSSNPKISSITPSSAFTGQAITIAGTNLENSSVQIGGIAAYINTNTSTSIYTNVPAGVTIGVQPVLVSNANGSASSSITVTGVGAPPVITSITPDTVSIGQNITIMGSGYAVGAGVEIATIVASSMVNSDTQITATIPTSGVASGQQAAVRVTTPLGTVVSNVYVN